MSITIALGICQSRNDLLVRSRMLVAVDVRVDTSTPGGKPSQWTRHADYQRPAEDPVAVTVSIRPDSAYPRATRRRFLLFLPYSISSVD
jgi:hypothetical protein